MRQNSPGSSLAVPRMKPTCQPSQICGSLPAGDTHRCVGHHLARLAQLYCLTFVSPRCLSLCITRSNVLGHPSGHRASLKGFTHTAGFIVVRLSHPNNVIAVHRSSGDIAVFGEGVTVRQNIQWIFAVRSVKSHRKLSWKAGAGELSVCHRPIPKARRSGLVLI